MLLTCHGNHHPGLLQRHPHGERGPLRYPTCLEPLGSSGGGGSERYPRSCIPNLYLYPALSSEWVTFLRTWREHKVEPFGS